MSILSGAWPPQQGTASPSRRQCFSFCRPRHAVGGGPKRTYCSIPYSTTNRNCHLAARVCSTGILPSTQYCTSIGEDAPGFQFLISHPRLGSGRTSDPRSPPVEVHGSVSRQSRGGILRLEVTHEVA